MLSHRLFTCKLPDHLIADVTDGFRLNDAMTLPGAADDDDDDDDGDDDANDDEDDE